MMCRQPAFFTIPGQSPFMAEYGPDACLHEILSLQGDGRWGIDTAHAIPGVTAYAVRSFDNDALLFSLPLIVHRPSCQKSRLTPGALPVR
jgi:hypothetical protein